MNDRNDRRKTLPVVWTEKDIEQHKPDAEHHISNDDLALSQNFEKGRKSLPNNSSTEIKHRQEPHWLQLSADINPPSYSNQTRRTTGIDVPGAITTRGASEVTDERPLDSKLVIIMVGLPARGKSYLVKKLRRYLNWLQYETKIFNVGEERRGHCKHSHEDQSAKFFDPENQEMIEVRNHLAMDVLEKLILWLKGGGRVAIHDATNSTISRRRLLIDRLRKEPEVKVLLLESVCTDAKMLERNFRLKLSGPDYRGRDSEEALADFKSRVQNYEQAYEPVGEWEESENLEYCKLINVGKKVVAYNISGYLSGQCIFYLMNFNLVERQIFLTRHGESEANLQKRIGGDASLTSTGVKFSRALKKFVEERRLDFAMDLASRLSKDDECPLSQAHDVADPRTPEEIQAKAEAISNYQFTIWTSMLKRTMETAAPFCADKYDIKHIRFLNEINSGACEGLSYKEIEERFPDEHKAREEDKLFYRYPGMGGESYIDVIHRLQSMIIELERMTQSCLIITHRAVMRILLGYMLDWTQNEMPHMDVPIHTVYEIQPKPYGTKLRRWRYVEADDSFVEFP